MTCPQTITGGIESYERYLGRPNGVLYTLDFTETARPVPNQIGLVLCPLCRRKHKLGLSRRLAAFGTQRRRLQVEGRCSRGSKSTLFRLNLGHGCGIESLSRAVRIQDYVFDEAFRMILNIFILHKEQGVNGVEGQ